MPCLTLHAAETIAYNDLSASLCSIIRAIALKGLNARSDYTCQYKLPLHSAVNISN